MPRDNKSTMEIAKHLPNKWATVFHWTTGPGNQGPSSRLNVLERWSGSILEEATWYHAKTLFHVEVKFIMIHNSWADLRRCSYCFSVFLGISMSEIDCFLKVRVALTKFQQSLQRELFARTYFAWHPSSTFEHSTSFGGSVNFMSVFNGDLFRNPLKLYVRGGGISTFLSRCFSLSMLNWKSRKRISAYYHVRTHLLGDLISELNHVKTNHLEDFISDIYCAKTHLLKVRYGKLLC